jgi:hypothetical protein
MKRGNGEKGKRRGGEEEKRGMGGKSEIRNSKSEIGWERTFSFSPFPLFSSALDGAILFCTELHTVLNTPNGR